MAVQARHPAAGRRGAGASSGAASDRRRADRALYHPPQADRRASGPGCAASRRRRRCESGGDRHRGGADQGHDGDRPGAACARASASSSRGAMRLPSSWRWCCGSPGSISGPTTGGTCTTPSRSCSTTPSWRCSPIGLTYVIAAGDIDLSVGAVLALAGAAAAFRMKVLGLDPMTAVLIGLLAGMPPGWSTRLITVGFGLPAFIATLGMFYIARGLAAWIVAGQQLTGFPESFNLLGRKLTDIFVYLRHSACRRACCTASAEAVSVQTICHAARRDRSPAVVLAYTPFGQTHLCNRRQPAAPPTMPASTPTASRFIALMFSALCATHRRHHLRRLLPQLQPDRGPVSRTRRHCLGDHRRRLDLRRLRHASSARSPGRR